MNRRPDIKESEIVQYLQMNLGGDREVLTRLGRVDLVVGDTIIECKVTYHYREPDNILEIKDIFKSYNIQLIVLIGDEKLRGISKSLISAKRRSALALFKVPD